MKINNSTCALVKELGELLIAKKQMLVTAESCTGGGLAQALTSLPDSGHWFERGFVTYSLESKQELLGVLPATLDKYGAVSEQTATEMLQGALKHSNTVIGAAITGLAGPDKGPEQKPVGTVCFAWGSLDEIHTLTMWFAGDREAVCEQSIQTAVQGLLDWTKNADDMYTGYREQHKSKA